MLVFKDQHVKQNVFFVGLVSRSVCLSIPDSKFGRSGLPNRGFRIESIAKIDFSWKSRLMNSGIHFCCFLEALGAVFLTFLALKTDLKTEGFL